MAIQPNTTRKILRYRQGPRLVHALFVYCKSGHRAALSTAALQLLGYSNVRAFPPGFAGWSSAGEPVAMAQ